jgi:hypothetical protein
VLKSGNRHWDLRRHVTSLQQNSAVRVMGGSVKSSFVLQEGDELVGLHCFRRLGEELDTAVESVNT